MRHDLPDGAVLQGHVLDALAELPAESVHMACTSPPYWGLRRYSGEQVTRWSDGDWAYGTEDTPERWANHTLEWLRAVRRVLRKDGTVWLNVGDSYSAGGRGDSATSKQASNKASNDLGPQKAPPGYKPLDLIHTPSLLIPRLLADGWFLRSVIVWAKPNPMPESVSGTRWERCRVKVKQGQGGNGNEQMLSGEQWRAGFEREAFSQWADCPGCARCTPNDGLVLRRGSWRPTEATEWVLMLAKSAGYYADGEGVREPHARLWDESNGGSWAHASRLDDEVKGKAGTHRGDHYPLPNPAGRNMRNVWTFPTEPFPQAHFATYPTELVRRCILAGTSEAGCCATCGAPFARVIETRRPPTREVVSTGPYAEHGAFGRLRWDEPIENQTLRFRPTSPHSGEAVPSTVLDPFLGSGTTAVVARSLGRRFVGIELSADYVHMALKRLEQTQPGMVLALSLERVQKPAPIVAQLSGIPFPPMQVGRHAPRVAGPADDLATRHAVERLAVHGAEVVVVRLDTGAVVDDDVDAPGRPQWDGPSQEQDT